MPRSREKPAGYDAMLRGTPTKDKASGLTVYFGTIGWIPKPGNQEELEVFSKDVVRALEFDPYVDTTKTETLLEIQQGITDQLSLLYNEQANN